ncbi:hypothetical protein HKD37_06G016178 [Glycine soja]
MIMKHQASPSPTSRFFTSQSHYTLHEFPNQLTFTLLLAEHEGRIWPIPVALQRSSRRVCLAAQSSIFRSQRCLGVGTSLPSLVATKLGACVTIIDDFTRLGGSLPLISDYIGHVVNKRKFSNACVEIDMGSLRFIHIQFTTNNYSKADLLYDSNEIALISKDNARGSSKL